MLEITPHDWQKTFLRVPRGASIAVLTARQVGKTTAAAVGMAHSAVFMPGSLSVVACPSQNQSAEALRKVRAMVLKAGAELTADNVFKLELANGSRVLALPGTEESIRGLTVDAWIVADEAAQLDPAIMAALHPMRTQRPDARFAMLSTAWSRSDPFWSVWENDDPAWTRIRATIDEEPNLIAPEVLERARRQLSADDFKREYLGVPAGSQVSPFTCELYQRATQTPVHTWDCFKFHIIAHDVGHKKDRSTAVIGGPNLRAPGLTGMKGFEELPQGLSGNSRADALAMIDSRYPASLIIADLSYDPSYADILVERFGERVIGLQITSTGDTIDNWEERQLKRGGSWSTRSAAPICSIYCSAKCKTRWCVFFMAQTVFALMSSSCSLKLSSSRTEWFINVQWDITTISPCHALCWCGPHSIRICQVVLAFGAASPSRQTTCAQCFSMDVALV